MKLFSSACLLAFALVLSGSALAASDVVVNDTQVFPENITALADGTVFLGSANKPIIYKAAPGTGKAQPWIHLTGSGRVTSLGIKADAKHNTLWSCQSEQQGGTIASPKKGILRSFDLKSGAAKVSYPLPGDTNLCNDIAVDVHGTAFVSDTPNGQILRVRRGGALELWLKDPKLDGIDGLTFLNGTLYVNSIRTGTLVRVPTNKDGSAGSPVMVALSRPLARPDGMRALGSRLFVAEGGEGKVSELLLDGDKAMVVVIKDGFNTPTGVEPVGSTLWVGESKYPYMLDPKLASQDPGPFKAYALPLPKR